MKKLNKELLKTFRKVYSYLNRSSRLPISEQNPDKVSQIIIDILSNSNSCMIARFGAYELNTLANYIGVTNFKGKIGSYITGKSPQFWWEPRLLRAMYTNAGFFPPDEEYISKFCQLLLKDISNLDILGSWLPEEKYLREQLESVQKVFLLFLDPFWSEIPWTKVLKNKKVLVVHPFSKTIKNQYKKRELLHNNKELLPEFDLETIKAVQSNAGEKTPFKNWFEALDFMKAEIDKSDYDICLIGAGAYGLHLAAHVKSMGKKAVHLGGSLQLLFGIKGKRWEDPDYNLQYKYHKLINKHWVRPSEDETPSKARMVEGACYW